MLTTLANLEIDTIIHQHFNRERHMKKTLYLFSLGLLLVVNSMTFGSQTEVTLQERTEPCICPVPRPSPLPGGGEPEPRPQTPPAPDPDGGPRPEPDPEL